MKLLKSFHNAFAMLVIMLSALQFASCSSSSDEPKPDSPSKISKDELVGTWNGCQCFKSAHGGYKYSYVTAELLSNGTGQVKQENNDDVITFMGGFTWTISGNTVKCQGVSASISGSVSMDFTISFEYRDGRLYAKDRFDPYILSKGSITCINSEGKEVIDRSDYLGGVWISDDGKDMLDIQVHGFDNYTQSHTLHIRTYILTPNSKDSYEEMIEDNYAGYCLVENTLWTISTNTENYNQVDFTITELNAKEMRLMHYDTVKRYTKGTYQDLPRKKNLDNKLAIIWEEFHDGITVLDLRTPGVYIEYTRTKAYSDTYTAKKVGSYSYDEDGLYMTITIGGQSETWRIEHLNEGNLTLSQSRKTMKFSPGDESSIPTIQEIDSRQPYLATPGDSNGWKSQASQYLHYYEEDSYFYGMVIIDGGFKLADESQNVSWGIGNKSGTLEKSGKAITVDEKGLYWVTANLDEMTYKLVKVESMGVIGSCSWSHWSTESKLTPNSDFTIWKGDMRIKAEDEWKVRINNDWNYHIGDELQNPIYNGGNFFGISGSHVTVDLRGNWPVIIVK